VTAAVHPAVSPLAPVIGALASMRGRYPVHGLVQGLYQHDRINWLSADTLVHGDGLDGLLDAAQRRWQAPRHVAATLAWKCYGYWVALPAVLGYATARRVPLMEPSEVLVRYLDRQPFLCAGLADPVLAVLPDDPIATLDLPRVRVVADDAELRRTLHESLIGRHLGPLVERLHLNLHLGRRTLWGSLASGVAHGLSRAADVLPGSTLDAAETLLTTLDLDGLVDLTPEPSGRLYVQRRTCCLAFTLAEPKICSGCVISKR
jgi:hypothetical protein